MLQEVNLEQPPNSPMSKGASLGELEDWMQDIDWDCWEDLDKLPLEAEDPPSPSCAPLVPQPTSPCLPAHDPIHPEFGLPLDEWDFAKVMSPRNFLGDPAGPAAQDIVSVAMAEATQKERAAPPRPP